MKRNKHIGSSFESFLEAQGILEEVNAAAIKAVASRKPQKKSEDNSSTQRSSSYSPKLIDQ